MEAEIRNSLVSSQGHSAIDLAHRYCRETVIDEIHEMISDRTNLDIAFLSALSMKEWSLVRAAAEELIKSGGYSKEIAAKAYNYLQGKEDL
jgi:pimeloyl-CoA synthetase